MTPTQWRALETYLLSTRDLATSTTKKTLGSLRMLERAGVDLARPRRGPYDAFLAKRKKEDRWGPGIVHYGKAIRHAIAWQRAQRYWPNFRLPRASSSPRELLPDHVVQALLEYQVGDDEEDRPDNATARACFRLAFYLALRVPSELHDLELQDFDQDARTLAVWSDKLERNDIVHLQTWEAQLVADYIATTRAHVARFATRGARSSSLMLHPWTGRPFSREGLRMFMWRHGRRVYPRFHGYSLRHAGLTWLYLQTRDIYFVKERARHVKLSSTEIYVHAAEALERRRAAAPLVQPFRVTAA